MTESSRFEPTVFVLDPDPRQADWMARILTERGYCVLTAASAEAASALAQNLPGPIQLLVADARSAAAVAATMRHHHPSMAALHTSARSADALPPGATETDVPFLQLPCTPQALGQSVGETLRRANAPELDVAAPHAA